MKSKIDQMFKDKTVDGFTPICVHELAKLTGFWLKPDLYTLSHQSVEFLQIPAFQLEIPQKIRFLLSEDEVLFQDFTKCIAELYDQVIVPWWEGQKPLWIPQY